MRWTSGPADGLPDFVLLAHAHTLKSICTVIILYTWCVYMNHFVIFFFSRQVWIIYIAPPTRAIIIARAEPHAGSSLERAKQPRREKNKIKAVVAAPFGRQKYIFCVVIIIIIEQLRYANARDLFHTYYIIYTYMYIRYFYYYYYYHHHRHSQVSTMFLSSVCTTCLRRLPTDFFHSISSNQEKIFITRKWNWKK